MRNSSKTAEHFAAAWTWATFLGWTLGFLLLLLFIALSGAVGLGNTQFPIGLGMGTGVGSLQRRMVAERVRARTGWWPASIIGLTIPFVLWDLAKLLHVSVPHGLIAAVGLGGLTVGLLQARVLRPHSPLWLWWVPASVIGWALAASTVFVNDRVLPKTPGIIGALQYIAVILLGGALLGVTTGFALTRILRPR